MYVITANSQEFDMGLKGDEFQQTFDPAKYKKLAYGSVAGAKLLQKVEDNWFQWSNIVSNAPWLRNWVRSIWYNRPGVSPLGLSYSTPAGKHEVDGAAIATAIYVSAVWGFGVRDWFQNGSITRHTRGQTKLGQGANDASTEIFRLQNVRCPNPARSYMWDDKLYRGCGIFMPIEFGELDRWLMGLEN